ncbi:MAG: hypothetical protein WCO60_11455 [Verrucomicrobiota bacterium]
MNSCRLCLQNRKFIKAHSIPEAFFRELREEEQSPRLVSGQTGFFAKDIPIGVYDQQMLCQQCELKFNNIDDYGIKCLLREFDKHFVPMLDGGRLAGFESTEANPDPERLLRFFVAVLWRASKSAQPFYKQVDLGPHEVAAIECVVSPDMPVSPVFDAVLARWCDEDESIPTTAMLNPMREQWSGVDAYRLYLGKLVAFVKVDHQAFPVGLKAVSLRSAPPIRLVARSMRGSKDLQAMLHTARRSHENTISVRNGRRSR